MTSPADNDPNIAPDPQDNGTADANGSAAPTAVVETTESPAQADEDGLESILPSFLNPPKEELPDEVEMSLFDHLEELRLRIFYS
ncbi:MAG: twin-arginine translocase subunit TatC, partial [Cyanobacteria bacterium P01_H01_bin.130]